VVQPDGADVVIALPGAAGGVVGVVVVGAVVVGLVVVGVVVVGLVVVGLVVVGLVVVGLVVVGVVVVGVLVVPVGVVAVGVVCVTVGTTTGAGGAAAGVAGAVADGGSTVGSDWVCVRPAGVVAVAGGVARLATVIVTGLAVALVVFAAAAVLGLTRLASRLLCDDERRSGYELTGATDAAGDGVRATGTDATGVW
jgi:hypothetical protein